jgi:hypothetical protein
MPVGVKALQAPLLASDYNWRLLVTAHHDQMLPPPNIALVKQAAGLITIAYYCVKTTRVLLQG